MNKVTLRKAESRDTVAMLQIYAPHVESSAVSFELKLPTVDEFTARLAHYQQKYPWIVAEIDGVVVGYAYASEYRSRQAYQWSCECSVYLSPEAQGQGVAKKLYDKVFAVLKKQGIVNIFAIITLPNAKSIRFHEKEFFTPVGIFKDVGSKFGRWFDVAWYVRQLNQPEPDPKQPDFNWQKYFD